MQTFLKQNSQVNLELLSDSLLTNFVLFYLILIALGAQISWHLPQALHLDKSLI